MMAELSEALTLLDKDDSLWVGVLTAEGKDFTAGLDMPKFFGPTATRKPRPGEVDGRDYVFVDEPTFKAMAREDQLLEWATVFGNYYGTPRAPIEKAIAEGRDVLFDIDWQGTQQLSERMAGDLVRVFVLPPSGEALEHRLRGRAQDPDEVVAKRMAEASNEISHWAEYDYVIVNADLEESSAALRAILIAERLRRDRMTGLSSFVRGLQAALT
ncbi:MAG: guanylate kinase [Rhizobiales bacterium]|nr:guanylate kinase [Hyphomicrobiales bacterium]